ncbi:MAG TPA: DUF2079 domain-containing protein [Ktedonobacteraceae bacterium]|jgi:uncharacterized membrane protein|nr:DUF2079 domain-containing protein [Ktedonobacteraceae bacterium]
MTQSTQLRLAWALLIALTLGYILWMSSLVVLRYTSFIATAFDLGNMDQVMWNTLHGHLFQWTNQSDNYFGPPIRLAQHVEPIILPLSLLYLIYPDPRTLLIFQTLVLASGTLPIFLLTRRYLPIWPLFAPVMVAAYLFSPALLGENLYDFHPVSLATPVILYAFLALVHRRYGWFLAACLLAMATKEDVPFTMALFGLLLIWKYKLPKLGSLLIVIGLLWFSLAFFVIMPHFLGAKNNNFWYRYADLGPTPLAAVKNILLHPWILFSYFVTLNRIYYLFSLFRSTSFLALLAPEWLLPILFSLAVNLLSSDASLYGGIYQYNATIIPFIIFAAIHGMQRVLICWQRWQGDEISLPAVGSLDPEPPHAIASQQLWLPQRALYLLKRGNEAIRNTFNNRPVAWLRPRIAAIIQVGKERWWSFGEQMISLARIVPVRKLQFYAGIWFIVMITLNWIIMIPELNYLWPQQGMTDRDRNIEQLLKEIPPDAAVSAGTNINPHVTERRYVTVFPAIEVATMQKTYIMVDYVIVDLQAVFPEYRNTTAVMLTRLVQSGQFCNLKQADGVILLKRCGP